MSPPTETPCYTGWATAYVELNGRKFFRSASASSPISFVDAEQQARKLARERAEAAAAGKQPLTSDGTYPYPERVLVEPVLERLVVPGPSGSHEIARVTRNSYDASVLNAYNVMFVDVDTTTDSSNAPEEKTVSQSEALEALADLIYSRPELQFRIYATKAGLRYLCTSHLFDPVSSESQDILKRLKADKRYTLLCRVQKCYRARLSPKYWRCVLKPTKKRGFFSRLLGSNETRVNPRQFATCHYLETVGTNTIILPEIALVLRLHDEASEAFSAKPLA